MDNSGRGRPNLELVIFIGLQASGKTSFYLERFAGSHVHVSKDLLRNNPRPTRRQEQLIREALAAGRSVVVDNTNPTRKERAGLIAIAREYEAASVGYYFDSDVRESLERNRTRIGRAAVPDVAVYATNKRMELPSFQEGFDRLYVVRVREGGGFDVTEWKDTMEAHPDRSR